VALTTIGTFAVGAVPVASAHAPRSFSPTSGYTVKKPPTAQQVNTTVFQGVEYIDCQQNTDGSFGTTFGFGDVPETAAAIIAYGVLDKGSLSNLPTKQSDPVCPATKRNFQKDLKNAVVWLDGQQDTTDPKGINLTGGSWCINKTSDCGDTTYSTGLALTALSLSTAIPVPGTSTPIATAIKNGRTFLENEFQNTNVSPPPPACSTSTASGQGTSYYCGGWNYSPGFGRSDQSNTGYAMTGLRTTGGVPPAIQTLNAGWETNDQSLNSSNHYWTVTYNSCTSNCPNDGGSGYQPYDAGVRGGDFEANSNDSGTFLFSTADDGLPLGDARVDAGLQFGTDILDTMEKTVHDPAEAANAYAMVFHTGAKEDGSCVPGTTSGQVACDWGASPGLEAEGGFHYSMFALAKGMGAFIPANLSDGTNWYAKIADLLVHQQNTTACVPATTCLFGSWPVNGRDDFTTIFASGLSIFALGLVATPPPPVAKVSTVTTSASCTQITFNWTNPTTPNYGGVDIQRSTTHVPANPTDGTRVADVLRPASTYTDTGLVSGTTYHYSLFAHDTSKSAFSAGVPVTVTPKCTPVTNVGYYLEGGDGGVFAFHKPFEGSIPPPSLGLHVYDLVAMADITKGYWLVGKDGGVFSFGAAHFHGSCVQAAAACHGVDDIVGVAATSDAGGYWLVGANGKVYPFGDAASHGSCATSGSGCTGTTDIVAISSPDSGGYWLVSSHGNVYRFGDAASHGSCAQAGSPCQRVSDIVGIAKNGAGGYWLAGVDGGVFSFGNAHYHGSCPQTTSGCQTVSDVVGIASPDSGGYWLAEASGNVLPFGDAKFFGRCGSSTSHCAPLVRPIVAINS
jgi:hypothetical protein